MGIQLGIKQCQQELNQLQNKQENILLACYKTANISV